MSGKTTNKTFTIKTLRFDPRTVDDAEKVLELTMEGGKPKYASFNNLVVCAVNKVIVAERRKLEDQGVAWEHLKRKRTNNINQGDSS